MDAAMNINSLNMISDLKIKNELFFQSNSSNGIDDNKLRSLTENKEGLLEASKAFESIFVKMLLKEMRSTVNSESGVLPRSNEREMYEELLDEKMAEEMSKKESLGISEAIQKAYGQHFKLEKSSALNITV